MSTGDAREPSESPDPCKAGKILRIAADGTVPGDNPWPGSAAWMIGVLDPLGRPFVNEEDPGGGQKYRTTVELDVQGNQLRVVDAQDKEVADQVFDMLGRRLRLKSCDAGESWTIPDVAGQPLYSWNQRGHVIRYAYDELRRPTQLHTTRPGETEVVTERTFYGEALLDGVDRNLRGRVCAQYHGAGLQTLEQCDSKGNVVSTYAAASSSADRPYSAPYRAFVWCPRRRIKPTLLKLVRAA